MSVVFLNALCAGLTTISFAFYLIGLVGYSSQNITVRDVSWYTFSDPSTISYYVGLERIVIDQGGDSFRGFQYSSCHSDLCNVCRIQGKSAFGLLIASVLLSIASAILCMIGSTKPTLTTCGVNTFVSMTAALFGVTGWGLFVDKCFPEVIGQLNQNFVYGPGAILTLIAFLLMALVFMIQVASVVVLMGERVSSAQAVY